MSTTRKDFLRVIVTLGGASALTALAGCSSSSDSGPSTGDTGTAPTDTGTKADTGGSCGSIAGDFDFNHGHVLDMPVADLTATGDKTYDIHGTATHTHSITFTEPQRKSIAGGTPVKVTTTTSGAHQHEITAHCA